MPSVLERVGEQVRHHLLQPQPIPLPDDGGVGLQPHLAAGALGLQVKLGDHLTRHGGQVHNGQVELKPPGAEP